MKVGFVGLGQMGAGIAANLLKAGHALTVYNDEEQSGHFTIRRRSRG